MSSSSCVKVTAPVVALLLATTAPISADEAPPPVDQAEINEMIKAGNLTGAFEFAFEAGDELTEFNFDATRGVGAGVGEGRRFSRMPRADLDSDGEWAQHMPVREGGPNATSCIACHGSPAPNGAGDVAMNVVVDPGHTGDPAQYLERNTPHLFALGIPQRLAEELSMDLAAQREVLTAAACEAGSSSGELVSKGVSFGTLALTRTATEPCTVTADASGLDGIDEDLIVKPFGWKGNHATIRGFTRDAAHNELGMQADELVGAVDGDYDGVTGELTVGDLTALTIYMAALERPVSTLELAELGLVEQTDEERDTILRGTDVFADVGCTSCHVPSMEFEQAVFNEPSQTPGFFDKTFPSGDAPEAAGLAYQTAVSFDLTKDQPNNLIEGDDGTVHLGAVETENGAAVARWYSDFKRHDMGEALADPGDPLGVGASSFLTRSLAGVGSTGPWMHDGRATTLDEAIRLHGGDAADSSAAYVDLAVEDQEALVAFLDSLVIYVTDEEEEEH